ncbi:MAG: 1-deoxy-D-xylulose-5-phosphate synthase [Actinobacteria bacterium]|nr:1-deoxy-D-xylulose-5-phosphate synthase [Actinomycetota bacterium]MCL5445949.1 1-deoxy-D-xylulose-5-phosphate synthase [Actinomycetota bacterium]
MLEQIHSPSDLQNISYSDLVELAQEIRQTIITTVLRNGGHLGSNLGIVELTIALHRVFHSPDDVLLFDTGHQTYVHKLLTGRVNEFQSLRQPGGMSGYPSRKESAHDWIENSHASTALSYAHGLAASFRLQGQKRRVIALVGDGSLTGGLAYEALNNIGHSHERVLIVLNDNGRSYAPTISRLSTGLTSLRLYPSYVKTRERLRKAVKDMPAVGDVAYSSIHRITSALREIAAPHQFFEALGIRYAGPIDSSNMVQLEEALSRAAMWEGPILLHVLSRKGNGYEPAEHDDIQRLHDVKPASPVSAPTSQTSLDDAHGQSAVRPAVYTNGHITSYTDAFSRALVKLGKTNTNIVAITAAMPGPTGLLPFKDLFPDRFFDVGIAEEHALTAAAGMAMGGLRPVVAVYSTFFSRAFDQANLDISLHNLPVTLVLDRAGITGDDGPSHNGAYDLALLTAIPGMTIFTPSSAEEIEPMLTEALHTPGPSAIRFPKTSPPERISTVGHGLHARLAQPGDSLICILAVGKALEYAEGAARLLKEHQVSPTVWDVRVVSPPDPEMLYDALSHSLVVTVEDGMRYGGAGSYLYQSMMDLCLPSTAGNNASSVPGESDILHVPYHLCLGLPRCHLAHNRPSNLLESVGLSAKGVMESILSAIEAFRLPLDDHVLQDMG